MPPDPKISVVMSVYNAAPYLRESIQSILDQTFTDFEFLIFNDGSTDDSLAIMHSFTDPRIKIFDNTTNRGIAANANDGIAKAKGLYIARMDGDDISVPERLQKEFDFLENHPDFGLIGGWIENIDANGVSKGTFWKFPAPSEEIPVLMLFNDYFANSTTMLRKAALPEILYREEFVPAEDYDLFARIIQNHNAWNLQEVLVRYRVHGQNISLTKTAAAKQSVKNIFKEMLVRMGVSPTPEEIDLHHALSLEDPVIDDAFLQKTATWYSKIYQANLETKTYDKVLLLKTILGRWYMLSRKSKRFFGCKLLWKNSLTLPEYIKLGTILLKRAFR